MSIQSGRRGKVFLKEEAVYGVAEVLAATNFMRHINVNFGWDPFARVTSPERKESPGPVNRFDRRSDASLKTLEGLIRPSGTLNTLPECSPVLKAGFGSVRNVTLSTTVSVGTGTVNGATLASAAGLAKKDAVLITAGGTKHVRFLTSVVGNVVTWAPALPSAPADGAAVKGCITYLLTTDLAISLDILHAYPAFKRELLGTGIDSLNLEFDGTEAARFTANGPAKEQLTPGQATPGAATEVGGNPPTGMVGDLRVGANAYKHTNFVAEISNGLEVRHSEAGTDRPTELFRKDRREVKIKLDAFAEDETAIYDQTETGANLVVLRQNGRTEGNIVAIYAPRVEFKPAETSDGEDEVRWAFEGMALESADGENDELILAIA